MKQTKCKICRTLYTKWSITQKTCPDPSCALELVKIDKAKKARKEHQAAKVKARTRSEWMKLAQQSFNKFIRLRDAKLPCISCGRFHDGKYDAGHYLTAGAHPEHRFNESNCHKQCVPCNQHLSGNIARYRINLISKIGIEKVEWLEGPHEAKKYTIPDLIAIRAEYAEKVKGLGI